MTGDEYRSQADDALYWYKKTGDDYWYSQYKYYLRQAEIADSLATQGGGGSGGGGGGSTPGDYISNYTNGVSVRGNNLGINADYILNNASNVTIYGGADNDTIRIESYASASNPSVNLNVKIYGNADNDYVENYGADKSLIDGGSGNDIIDNWGKNVTIIGGTGNDSIKLDRDGAVNCVIEYGAGDGNDTVVGFGTNSTLKIGGGTGTYSTTQSGSNVIVTVGDGKITLVGAANLSAVHIQGSSSGGGGTSTGSGGSSTTPRP